MPLGKTSLGLFPLRNQVWPVISNFPTWLEKVISTSLLDVTEFILSISHIIWYSRGKICFQGKTLNIGATVCGVWNLIEDHKAMFNTLHMDDDNPQSASPPTWSPPMDNFYKINVGVAGPEDGVWRFGTIIWDDECVVLLAVTWKITILPNVDVVETMSFRLTLQFIVNLGFWCIMIEGVSINVVRVINAYFLKNNYYMSLIIVDCHNLLSLFTLFVVDLVKRFANVFAHTLAEFVFNFIWHYFGWGLSSLYSQLI